MRINALFTAIVLLGLALPAQAEDGLVLAGELEHPTMLTLAQLRALPAKDLPPFQLKTHDGKPKGPARHYRGVLLRDLLLKAGVKDAGKRARVNLYLTAGASDGYRVLFSWREVFDTPVGDGLMVVLDQDGKPLSADDGPLALVSGADRTGPRHVRSLTRVDVVLAP